MRINLKCKLLSTIVMCCMSQVNVIAQIDMTDRISDPDFEQEGKPSTPPLFLKAKGVVTVMSSAEEELTILLSLHLTHPSPMVFISLTGKK